MKAQQSCYHGGMTDEFNLERFVEAQTGSYANALAEIQRGAKRTHWMWFVFPQLAGLGHSEAAKRYAIGSIDEARAYLAHPVLGPRLTQCVAALQDLSASSTESVFGPVDALKLRSSLTLFVAAGGGLLFAAALNRWYDGPDNRTMLLLSQVDA